MNARRFGCCGVAAAVLLAGCASMAPPYVRPAAPVPAVYPEPDPGTSSAAHPAAADVPWQQFFADPTLRSLIDAALAHNRDLRTAALSVERARALAQVRRADALPTVNAAAAASRQPGSNGDINSLYTAGLAVSAYELDFFGRVRSLSDAALAQYLATEEARKTAQISLIATVARTWLSLQAGHEALALTERTLKSREESLQLTRLKFDNGVVSELDVRQVESLIEAARVTRAQLQRQVALERNALALLVGQTPLPAQTDLGAPLPELPAGLPSELLVRRPDIRQAEQQLRAANANIGAARAAFFPRLTLTGSVGVASSELSRLFGSGSLAWSFMPQLTLPIFDGGRNQANLEVSQVDRELALVQYEKAIQVAFREVADALANRAALAEQLRAQLALVEAESARLRLADLRYRGGVASYLDLLDAQRSSFAAEQAALQLRLQQRQNQVTLYQVLGGGWGGRPGGG